MKINVFKTIFLIVTLVPGQCDLHDESRSGEYYKNTVIQDESKSGEYFKNTVIHKNTYKLKLQCDESYLGEFPYKDSNTSYKLKLQINTSYILKVNEINDGENNCYIKTNMTNVGKNNDKEKSIKLNDGENSDIKKSNKQNVGENNDKEKSIKPNDGENSDTKKSNKPNVGEDIDDIETTRKRADPPGQQNFFSFFMQQQRYSKLFETMITFLNEYGFVYIVCMLYIFYRSILNTKLKNNAMHPETLSRKYKSS